jgi:hypothetical protein
MADELSKSIERAIELSRNIAQQKGSRCLVNAGDAFAFPKKSLKKCASTNHPITTAAKS